MATSEQNIVKQIHAPVSHSGVKVTVVGAGQVGMACAFSIITQVNQIWRVSPNRQIFENCI